MKKALATLATLLAVLAFGMPETAVAQARLRQMTAEVMTVNRGAEALTVRSFTPDGRAIDSVFSVQSSVASALDDLRPGEVVRITYAQVNDQLRAQRIVKVGGVTP